MIMSRRAKKLGSFKAKDTAGNQFTIMVYREVIEVSDLSGSDTMAGDYLFRSADGTPVDRLGKGRYQILRQPPVEVTSDASNAI